MPISRADRRLLVVTGSLVVLAGLFVGIALLVATHEGGTPVARAPLYIGVASDLREKIHDGGPLYFANPFAGPGFWLDIQDSQLTALALIRPGTSSCQVKWRATHNAYIDCNGHPVPPRDLARYTTTVAETGAAKGGVFVDLRKRLPPPDAAAA